MNLFKTNIRFDGEKTCLHYYLCAYLTAKVGNDPLSESIINFKNGSPEHVNAWIDCAVKRIKPLRIGGHLIIRSLHSDETEVETDSTHPLDLLGRAIAAKYRCTYLPSLLSKTRPTRPLHRIATKSERVQELTGVYQVDRTLTELSGRWILLIDDVVTTGVTARAIIRALKAADRSVFIIVFSLARTDYDPAINKHLDLHGDSYIWNSDKAWVLQEQSPFYLPGLLAAQDKNLDFGDPDCYVG